jgi:hypothetical protein
MARKKKRGDCALTWCTNPAQFRISVEYPEPEAEEAKETDMDEEEREVRDRGEWIDDPPSSEAPPVQPLKFYRPKPNPFVPSDYESPSFFKQYVIVCAEHVDHFKLPWEKQGAVTVVPFDPLPKLPQGHYVRVKRHAWSGDINVRQHLVGHAMYIECETLAPESWEGRTVILYVDEDDIVALMKETREAAIRTRSRPMEEP